MLVSNIYTPFRNPGELRRVLLRFRCTLPREGKDYVRFHDGIGHYDIAYDGNSITMVRDMLRSDMITHYTNPKLFQPRQVIEVGW